MTIICVDDEDLILNLTISMCHNITGVTSVVGFTRGLKALDWIKNNPADIVLLDINMPDIDGISLAVRIKEVRSDAVIIFLTGYGEHAVDAFSLHASGYLLKPVSPERLEEEIRYAVSIQPKKPSSHIVVETFGEFDIIVDGTVVAFARSRAKELLAYLIDRQGRSISRGNVFSALWEDTPYDRPMQKQLDVIIRSLKSTLEEYGISEILEMKRGYLRIRPELLDCDLYRFFDGDISAVNAYRGEYMSAYSWASLTESYMDRLNENC